MRLEEMLANFDVCVNVKISQRESFDRARPLPNTQRPETGPFATISVKRSHRLTAYLPRLMNCAL
ncbi:hypothetical protein EMEDMD4_10186 [Sinorhizobium medicae]|uniref:Uncharacterized protein n=1 Tax=Sinorhizobium medicae TaxID=110321 RepID=A0A508WNH7_9HYPH|nr:hypothetical protein EMEDMD4_10186 [Sinorhizobium medicae]